MNEGAAFLAAIHDCPDDSALRLVYADWLEENGDPRGELIRIEERIRSLAVWCDEFWELKPIRLRLRSETSADWLAKMGYDRPGPPIFLHGIPEGWRERWRQIREYADRWHGKPMGDVGGRVEECFYVEEWLDRSLPPSVREWVAFAHDVRRTESDDSVLIGHYEMLELDGNEAVSLLADSEEVYRWAVRYADFGSEDPLVYGYLCDAFAAFPTPHIPDPHPLVPTTRLTTFALGLVLGCTSGGAGGYQSQVDDVENLKRELESSFPVNFSYCGSHIYEGEGIIVCLSDDYMGRPWVRVEITRLVPVQRIPRFLLNRSMGLRLHQRGMFARRQK